MLKIHFCMSYLGTVSKYAHYLLSWIASEDIPIRISYSVIRIDARKAGTSATRHRTEPQKQTSFFDILLTKMIISHIQNYWKVFSLCWGGKSPLGYSANSPPTPFIERRARIDQDALARAWLAETHERPAQAPLDKEPSHKNSLCPDVPLSTYKPSA